MKDANAALAETLRIRATTGLIEALDKGADATMRTRSNYVRQAIVDRLKADGVLPKPQLAGAA